MTFELKWRLNWSKLIESGYIGYTDNWNLGVIFLGKSSDGLVGASICAMLLHLSRDWSLEDSFNSSF